MTADQFSALAYLIRSPSGPAQSAARLVLVDGLRQVDAARAVGVSAVIVSQSCKRFRAALEMARCAVG